MMDRPYNVYVFGCGNEYNRFSSYLDMYAKQINVLGIVTSQKQKFATMDGYPMLTIEEMKAENVEYIIIAVEKWKEIAECLYLHGVKEEQIIRSSVFYYPHFELNRYLQLKKSNISILSNSCLGGVIYKELGLKVLSPTVNMYCLGKDYLKFIKDYEYYLKLDMDEYTKDDEYIDKTMGIERFTPKGIIGNEVVWNFNHHENAKDAVTKWNELRGRVNFDNIAVIMIMQCEDELYEFEKISINKKIGIYHKKVDLEGIVYCPLWEEAAMRYKYRGNWMAMANAFMCNSRGYVAKIDWLKFLTGEKNYLRY